MIRRQSPQNQFLLEILSILLFLSGTTALFVGVMSLSHPRLGSIWLWFLLALATLAGALGAWYFTQPRKLKNHRSAPKPQK